MGQVPHGTVLFRKRLRRDQVLAFFAAQPRCLVAMEACASAHYWAREIAKLGHEVRLIAPTYVKPYRQAAEEQCRRCRSDLHGEFLYNLFGTPPPGVAIGCPPFLPSALLLAGTLQLVGPTSKTGWGSARLLILAGRRGRTQPPLQARPSTAAIRPDLIEREHDLRDDQQCDDDLDPLRMPSVAHWCRHFAQS